MANNQEQLHFADNIYVKAANQTQRDGGMSYGFLCNVPGVGDQWFSKLGDNENPSVSVASITKGHRISFNYAIVDKNYGNTSKTFYNIRGDITIISAGQNNQTQQQGTKSMYNKNGDGDIGVTVGAGFNQASTLFANCSQPFTRAELNDGTAAREVTTLAYALASNSIHIKHQIERDLQSPTPAAQQPMQQHVQQARQPMAQQAQQPISYTSAPQVPPQQQGHSYNNPPHEPF